MAEPTPNARPPHDSAAVPAAGATALSADAAQDPNSATITHASPEAHHHEAAQQPDNGQWSHFSRVVITIAAIGAAMMVFHTFASIVAPGFLALNLVLVVYPVFRWLVRHRVPRGIAAAVMLLVMLAILALFAWGIAYSVAATVQQLTTYSGQFSDYYHRIITWLSRFGVSQDMVTKRLKGIDPSSIAGAANSLVSSAQGGFAVISTLVLTLFFITLDAPSASARLDAVHDAHPNFVDALHSFSSNIRSFWVVTTVFGLIVAGLDWGVLKFLGVPLALVWAVLSFLTNYIPNIGFVVGLVPPALLALFAKDWKTAVIVVIAYCVLNFVVQSMIQPKFASSAVGVTATLSFISLFVWTVVLGGLGALMALPCTLLVKALLIDADPAMKSVGHLVNSDAPDAKKSGKTGSGRRDAGRTAQAQH